MLYVILPLIVLVAFLILHIVITLWQEGNKTDREFNGDE